MKLNIEFLQSQPAERSLKNNHALAPIFLTHDGVSGHVRVDSAENPQALSGPMMEIRLVGMESLLVSKI